MFPHKLILSICIFYIVKCVEINPTISNSSGDWYIVSKSQQHNYRSNYIECNNKEYCAIICDTTNGCIDIIINGTGATNIDIKCMDDFSCKNMKVMGAINTSNIYCYGDKSCSFGHIDLSNTLNIISITCSSNINHYACFKNAYYLNKETIINIDCFGVGCYDFGDIHTENDKLLHTQFYINGCNECHNLSQCIANYSIYCNINDVNATKTDLFINGYCKSQQCGCNQSYHQYIISNDECPITFELQGNNPMIIKSKVYAIIIAVVITSYFIGSGIICCLYSEKRERKKKMKNKPNVPHKLGGYNKVITQSEMDNNNNNNDDDIEDVNDKNNKRYGSTQENGEILLPKKIFPDNYDKNLHRKSKRKFLSSYDMEEIRKHNTSNSCWIIVDELVLDVTKFLKYHPGDIESIIKYGGTRCDQYYQFHSTNGKQLFFKFVIGKVEGANHQNCIIQSL